MQKKHIFNVSGVIIGMLCIALTFASCSSDAPKIQHPTYRYTIQGVTGKTYHAGDQVPIVWTAVPTNSDSSQSAPVTLHAQLTSATNPTTGAPMDSIGTPVTLQTTDWTNEQYTSTIQLPKDILPGTYAIHQDVTIKGQGNFVSTEGTNLRITVIK